ncbi:DUF2637 domain-containing protein [Nocardiopsis sp. EMB25]|uniref:DUF2637 domain-containing protein n=1 Tax=Nocardiopsis sp. EMB25 TaxID=2835867 RepID=UPI002283FA59|nr:DUF2637 domain-containing protein [Nocardiopsis sp. EMB25]MCY9786810.1 DUF2637 domain-containing protein [Nocardiopsis sp. EMB25]
MSSPNTPQKKLSDGQSLGLALAVTGMLAVGAYGLVISYWTVRELAVKLHMPLPHIFPVGIEGGMIAVLAIDIVLTWIGRPIGWLRQVARALSATAISINAYAGAEYGPAAVVMHALAPAILIVGVEALRHHLLVVLQVPEEREPIPRGRWLLAPLSTLAMWRRMVLWQQPRYSEALDTHLDRHEALAELRRAFGWRWKHYIPAGLAYRLRVGVRLAESTAEVRALLDAHYAHDAVHDVREVPGHDVRALPASAPVPPTWVHIDDVVRVRVGGDRVDGHLDLGGRALLPVVCAHRARKRAEALARGDRAVADLLHWRDGGGARERVARARADAHDAVGSVRADSDDAHIERQVARGVEQLAAWLDHEDGARTSSPASDAREESVEREQRADRCERELPARVAPAARARRSRGKETRARIVAHIEQHPEDDAERIGEQVGVSASTVRRHLREIRDR